MILTPPMKPIRLLTAGLAFFITAIASAGPTVLYVSESGEKRIAVYTLNEATGELARAGATDLPGATGSLAVRRRCTCMGKNDKRKASR